MWVTGLANVAAGGYIMSMNTTTNQESERTNNMNTTTNSTRKEATPNERAFLAGLDTKAISLWMQEAISNHNDEMFWLLTDEIVRRRDAR